MPSYTFGSYTIEYFTSGSGTWTPPAGVTAYDTLIVAGGGGGGSGQGNGAGAGGAGGLLWLTAQSCTPGVGISYAVGAAGTGGSNNTLAPGGDGGNSTLGSNTATGGGGGGAGSSGTSANNGRAGGSGGSGAGATSGNTATGGAGTSGQGSNGGSGFESGIAGNRAGGGGGGKGSTGTNGASTKAGNGGTGYDASADLDTTLGVSGLFAGGGGGGVNSTSSGNRGTAVAGGGAGGFCVAGSQPGVAGTANTGGGGGGGSGTGSTGTSGGGGAGGSGIVAVRYLTPAPSIAATALPAVSLAVGAVASVALGAGLLVTALPGVGIEGAASASVSFTSAVDLTVTAQPGVGVVLAPAASAAFTQTLNITATPGVALASAPAASFEVQTGFTVTAQPGWALGLAPSAQVLIGTEPVDTDITNSDDGLDLDGTAEVLYEPAVVPRPTVFGPQLPDAITVARVITTAPGWADTFSPAVATTKSIPRLRERVTIGDADMTFLRDTPLVVDNLRFIDPLLFGSGQITAPQINPQFEPNFDYDDDGELVGTGDLTGIRRHAHVVVDLVDADDVVQVSGYWKGFVAKLNADGHQLVLELGGQASGRLSVLEVKKPGYRRKQDVEHILVDLLRDARVRAHEHDGESGIGLIKRGEADGLSIFNETLAVWGGITGDAITFTPNATGAYRKTVKGTAIDATAYIDSDLVSQSLSRDFMSEVTRVYATGRTAAGELVSNFKTPGLTQGDAPDYPVSPGPIELGMTDDDTDSGAGVTAVQQQLAIHDFYDVGDGEPGIYGDEVRSAVLFFQAFAGLGTTGEVNAATWDKLWNLDEIGYSLDEAREYPTAQNIRTQKWFRTANGSKIEENPDYDPHLIPVDLSIDVGGPFGKNHITAFAGSKLAPAGGVWTGTLTFRSGLITGEHNPGDPFTTADVIDRRELQPNMRVWLPYFMGGITATISGVDHGPEESQAIVSTLPESTMDTWAAIERMREAQSNPGSTWSGHVRASQVRNDEGREWDTSSGWLSNKVALVEGWNEVEVPAGQAGTIQIVHMELEVPAEFAVILSQTTISTEALNTNDYTGEPLVDPRPLFRPWIEQDSVLTWLRARGLLDAWGTEKQPCGYDPTLKTDELGSTGQAPTGKFIEVSGVEYETGAEPVLFLYVWVGEGNNLLPGRILRNERRVDF